MGLAGVHRGCPRPRLGPGRRRRSSEDDIWHADGLGCRIDGAEHRDHAGDSWPATSAPDGPGQGDRDRTGDGQGAGSVAVADQGATGTQQDIAAAQRRSGPPSGIGHRLVRPGRSDVEFSVGGAAGARRGQLAGGLADVGPDHDQAVPAKRPGLRALTSKRRDSSGGAERRPHVRHPCPASWTLCGSDAQASARRASSIALRSIPGTRDHRCDQDSQERAGHGETGRDGTAWSAEASMGACDGPGRVRTAIGLLITQRSRVQIPPPLLVSAGQGLFLTGRGPLRITACDQSRVHTEAKTAPQVRLARTE
jgi:hypothetical protein